MSDFEKQVPDLELCKRIPKGAFAESVLVWSYSCDKRKTEPFVEERDCIDFCRRDMINAPPVYPAPTLQEIMRALPESVEYKFFNGKFLPCHPKFDEENFADEKPENAALKLWLGLNNYLKRNQETGGHGGHGGHGGQCGQDAGARTGTDKTEAVLHGATREAGDEE